MAPNLGLNTQVELTPTGTPTYPEGSWGNHQKPKPRLSRAQRREIGRKLRKINKR